MDQVQVSVLGSVSVVDESGACTEVSAAQEQVLLTAVAVAGTESVSNGRLIDLIWGDSPPSSASGSLKTLVHRLRRRHGRRLITTTQTGYRIGNDVSSDYAHVVALSSAGTLAAAEGDPATAVDLLAAAAAQFRGDPPAALASTPAGLQLHRMLETLRLRVRDDLFDARLAAGEGESLVIELESAVAADPLAEANWGRLMVALYRSGRQAAALGAFQRARVALVDTAGLEPGPSLRAIERRIIDQDPTLVRNVPSTPDLVVGASDVTGDPRDEVGRAGRSGRATVTWYDESIGLVGRRDELDRIMGSIFTPDVDTPHRLVLIDGDAGIGKTRIAGEAAALAEDRGFVVLYGQCDPDSDAAYRPFTRAVEYLVDHFPTALDRCPPGVLAELVRFAPRLAESLPPPGSPREHGGRDSLDRDHAMYADLLDSLADPGGVLLIIDDIHWAPAPSLSLLRRLAGTGRRSNVTIIATYRPGDITSDSNLHMHLAALHRLRSTTAIHLDGLGIDEIRTFIEVVSDQHEIPDSVTDWMEHATSGVPYLIGAVLRHLTDTNRVVRRDRLWQLADGTLDEVPTGIRHLVADRLATLTEPTRRLLSVAAVAGLEFDVDAVAAVTGLAADGALDAVESATLAGLVHEDDVGRWRWEHDLARTVVLEAVSMTRRVRVHWDLACALAARSGADRAAIAHHAIEGIRAAPPVEAARLLAEAAEDVLDHDAESAFRCADIAYRNLRAGEADRLRAELLVIQAIAVGEIPGGSRADLVRLAEEAAFATDDADLIVRAVTLDDRAPAHQPSRAEMTDHLRATKAALAVIPGAMADQRALLSAHIIEYLHFAGPGPVRSEAVNELCHQLGGDRLSPAVRDHVVRKIRDNLPIAANTDDHLAILRAAVDGATVQPGSRVSGDPVDAMIAAIADACTDGRFGHCCELLDRLMPNLDGANAARELGVRGWIAKVRSARGDHDGLEEVRGWLEDFTVTDSTRYLHWILTRDVRLGIVLLGREAPESMAIFEGEADDSEIFPSLRAALRIAITWITSELGDDAGAMVLLDEIIATGSGLGGTIETTALYSDLLCRYRPGLAPDSGAVEVLSDYAGQWLFSVGFCIGPVDYYLAKLARAAGEDPTVSLERALASARSGGAAFWAERISAFSR